MTGVSICQSICKKLRSLLHSDTFKKECSIGNRFVRKRKLGFINLFYFLLHLSKKSLSIQITDFEEDFPELQFPTISKQAISKARKGIAVQGFAELVHLCAHEYYECKQNLNTWNGYSVFAIDGTTLQMPQTEENLREFGISTNQSGTQFAMGSASVIYDVLNDIIVDAQINICNYSERKFALKHIEALQNLALPSERILIFDRGYVSCEFCHYLDQKGILFVMRVKKSSRALRNTQEDDVLIEYGVRPARGPITKLRALRIKLPDEDEILLTNIFSTDFSVDTFKELYFLRWGVETKYKELKSRLLIEKFSGNSPHAVRQDFYISIFYSNLVAILKQDVDDEIKKDTESKKAETIYQCNRSYLIRQVQKNLVKLLIRTESNKEVLERIVSCAKKVRSQIRPNRKYERKVRHTKRKHHDNYKPCL